MSSKIFVDDSVTLILNTNKVLTALDVFKIKYEKPNGIRSHWDAIICPGNPLCIRATVQFDMSGLWKIQAFAQETGAPPAKFHGTYIDIKVYEPLAPDTTAPPTTVPPTTLAPTT